MTHEPWAMGYGLVCRDLGVVVGRRIILDGVDLTLAAGEWLGLIGPNGAGKSTLLRAIAGLVAHTGSVAFADGRRPGAADLAMVPQNPTIPVGMTVSEYVLLGRTAHLGWLARESRRDRLVVESVLRQLGLEVFAERQMTQLSGGEAQRAILARALAQQTPVLLLDEPTGALDIGHQSAALDLIEKLRQDHGFSVLAAMHDLTTAARCADRLALIRRGRIVVSGTPASVLDAGLLSEVYETPLTVRRIDGELVVLARPRRVLVESGPPSV